MIESLPGDELSTDATMPEGKPSFHFSRRQSTALVFGCTILGAAAQILMKSGANVLSSTNPVEILTNPLVLASYCLEILLTPTIFAGYCLYGLSTVLLVLALRDGELSILYPIISLTFAWVTILSVIIFHDAVNALKIVGISVIILGVAILGRDGRQ